MSLDKQSDLREVLEAMGQEYGVTSVSYTHLDVYKRQLVHTARQAMKAGGT